MTFSAVLFILALALALAELYQSGKSLIAVAVALIALGLILPLLL